MEQPEGGGGGRAPLPQISYFVLFLLSVAMPSIIYTERLFCFPANFSFFVSRSHLLSLCQLFFVSPGGASDIASRLYCLRSSTSFVSTLSKTKENHSSAHARSLPATEFVCIMGCSLLSCSTLLRHIVIISAALLFCLVFFFCFPRYLLWSLAQSPFVSRGGLFGTSARCLLSWNLEFFCFNLEQNKRKLYKIPCPVRASYCLANFCLLFPGLIEQFA